MRCRRHEAVLRPVGLFDGRPNLVERLACLVHHHRVTRDIYADASTHAVEVPRRFARRVPRRDEAVVVADMAARLTPAEAWHVLKDIRASSGELVHRLYHLDRAGEFILRRRER